MKKSIEERIWCSLPSNEPAFLKLLELLEIRETSEIPTAAVTTGFHSRLLINPDFVARHCTTDDRLATLVLHELYHILLGHTRLYQISNPIQNWALDAIINSNLSVMYPADTQTALFRACYRPDVFPEALLRPPVGWPDGNVQWHLRGEAGQVHRTLYTGASATFDEVMALMEKALSSCGEALDIAVLLGNHAEDGGFLPSIDPDFVREVRRIEAQFPRDVKGHGSGGELVRKEVKRATARAQAVRIIRRAILDAAPERMLRASPREPQGERVCAVLPYRTGADRRAAVYDALGAEPLAYRAESWAPSSRVYEPIHVYVDVSGSMDHVLPLIYGALRPLLPLIHKKIHLFSTVVRDVQPAGIHRGISETTQGTDLVPRPVPWTQVCAELKSAFLRHDRSIIR